jgi:predicted acyl esterase
MKDSYVNALYSTGCNTPITFCTTTNPNWDLGAWRQRLNQGEPYTGSLVTRILHQTMTYHSSYYIDHSEPPAPLLIANGWTDDLFPADEALRFYNRTKTQYPDAPVSLFFGDWGHPRAQNKAADIARYVAAVDRWLDYYVRGHGHKPFQGVEALTETCPATARSGGPYRASDWAHLSPGEVRLTSEHTQTILPDAGSPAIGATFNPISAAACATALPGATSQVAARLLDVAPNGLETLVSRGLWRPTVGTKPVRQVFQLHPGGWYFAPGDTVKLELLPNDAPYGRASNGQRTVTVSHLQLRLPTVNRPGADGGLVRRPLPKFLPPGYVLAREFARLR